MTPSPAPWKISGDLIVGAPEPRPNPKAQHEGRAIAKLCWDFDGDRGANGDLPWAIAKANGQLIIAAPDLLEACKFAVSCIDPDYRQTTVAEKKSYELLTAAIAKAQGVDQ